MTIKFYVNGVVVDTYKCDCTDGQLSADDEETIQKIKMDAYRNYGYPVITEVINDK